MWRDLKHIARSDMLIVSSSVSDSLFQLKFPLSECWILLTRLVGISQFIWAKNLQNLYIISCIRTCGFSVSRKNKIRRYKGGNCPQHNYKY